MTLDFEEATRRKEAGLAVAEQAASDQWKAHVRAVTLGMNGEFMAEDVRALCEAADYPATSPNHWGMQFRNMAREGVIVALGYRATRSPATHGHPARFYRVK